MNLVPILPRASHRKRTDKYNLSTLVEEGTIFLPCPVGTALVTHQNRLMAACNSRGIKVITRQTVEGQLAGVRLWLKESIQ